MKMEFQSLSGHARQKAWIQLLSPSFVKIEKLDINTLVKKESSEVPQRKSVNSSNNTVKSKKSQIAEKICKKRLFKKRNFILKKIVETSKNKESEQNLVNKSTEINSDQQKVKIPSKKLPVDKKNQTDSNNVPVHRRTEISPPELPVHQKRYFENVDFHPKRRKFNSRDSCESYDSGACVSDYSPLLRDTESPDSTGIECQINDNNPELFTLQQQESNKKSNSDEKTQESHLPDSSTISDCEIDVVNESSTELPDRPDKTITDDSEDLIIVVDEEDNINKVTEVDLNRKSSDQRKVISVNKISVESEKNAECHKIVTESDKNAESDKISVESAKNAKSDKISVESDKIVELDKIFVQSDKIVESAKISDSEKIVEKSNKPSITSCKVLNNNDRIDLNTRRHLTKADDVLNQTMQDINLINEDVSRMPHLTKDVDAFEINREDPDKHPEDSSKNAEPFSKGEEESSKSIEESIILEDLMSFLENSAEIFEAPVKFPDISAKDMEDFANRGEIPVGNTENKENTEKHLENPGESEDSAINGDSAESREDPVGIVENREENTFVQKLRVRDPTELGCARWCPTPAVSEEPLKLTQKINVQQQQQPIYVSSQPIHLSSQQIINVPPQLVNVHPQQLSSNPLTEMERQTNRLPPPYPSYVSPQTLPNPGMMTMTNQPPIFNHPRYPGTLQPPPYPRDPNNPRIANPQNIVQNHQHIVQNPQMSRPSENRINPSTVRPQISRNPILSSDSASFRCAQNVTAHLADIVRRLANPNTTDKLNKILSYFMYFLQEISRNTVTLRDSYRNRPMGMCSPELVQRNLVLNKYLQEMATLLNISMDQNRLNSILTIYSNLTGNKVLNFEELNYIIGLSNPNNLRSPAPEPSVLQSLLTNPWTPGQIRHPIAQNVPRIGAEPNAFQRPVPQRVESNFNIVNQPRIVTEEITQPRETYSYPTNSLGNQELFTAEQMNIFKQQCKLYYQSVMRNETLLKEFSRSNSTEMEKKQEPILKQIEVIVLDEPEEVKVKQEPNEDDVIILDEPKPAETKENVSIVEVPKESQMEQESTKQQKEVEDDVILLDHLLKIDEQEETNPVISAPNLNPNELNLILEKSKLTFEILEKIVQKTAISANRDQGTEKSQQIVQTSATSPSESSTSEISNISETIRSSISTSTSVINSPAINSTPTISNSNEIVNSVKNAKSVEIPVSINTNQIATLGSDNQALNTISPQLPVNSVTVPAGNPIILAWNSTEMPFSAPNQVPIITSVVITPNPQPSIATVNSTLQIGPNLQMSSFVIPTNPVMSTPNQPSNVFVQPNLTSAISSFLTPNMPILTSTVVLRPKPPTTVVPTVVVTRNSTPNKFVSGPVNRPHAPRGRIFQPTRVFQADTASIPTIRKIPRGDKKASPGSSNVAKPVTSSVTSSVPPRSTPTPLVFSTSNSILTNSGPTITSTLETVTPSSSQLFVSNSTPSQISTISSSNTSPLVPTTVMPTTTSSKPAPTISSSTASVLRMSSSVTPGTFSQTGETVTPPKVPRTNKASVTPDVALQTNSSPIAPTAHSSVIVTTAPRQKPSPKCFKNLSSLSSRTPVTITRNDSVIHDTAPILSPSVTSVITPRKNPVTTSKTSPSVTTFTAPRPSPSVTPTMTRKNPVTTPEISPSVPSFTAPRTSPSVTPTTTPRKNPVSTPETSSSVPSFTAPRPNPSVTPMMTPRKNPVSTPETSSSVTSCTAPRATPSATSMTTPRKNPVTTPDTSSSVTSFTAPRLSPSVTPMTTPRKNLVIHDTAPILSPSVTPVTTPRKNPVTHDTAPILSPSVTPVTTPQKNPVTTPRKSSSSTIDQLIIADSIPEIPKVSHKGETSSNCVSSEKPESSTTTGIRHKFTLNRNQDLLMRRKSTVKKKIKINLKPLSERLKQTEQKPTDDNFESEGNAQVHVSHSKEARAQKDAHRNRIPRKEVDSSINSSSTKTVQQDTKKDERKNEKAKSRASKHANAQKVEKSEKRESRVLKEVDLFAQKSEKIESRAKTSEKTESREQKSKKPKTRILKEVDMFAQESNNAESSVSSETHAQKSRKSESHASTEVHAQKTKSIQKDQKKDRSAQKDAQKHVSSKDAHAGKKITKKFIENLGEKLKKYEQSSSSASLADNRASNMLEGTTYFKNENLKVKQELNCLQCNNESIVACERCKAAFYCSKECQERHWRSGHYKICKPGK